MIGDEAAHWLALQENLSGNFTLHPFGHDYLGVTDHLFVLPFIPLFGNSGIALQLGLFLIYALFSWFLYQITVLMVGKDKAYLTLVFLAIPNPFILSLSAVFLSGHFSGVTFWCGSILYLLRTSIQDFKENKSLFNPLMAGILAGIAYYSSHLNQVSLIATVPFLFYIALRKLYSKETGFHPILHSGFLWIGVGFFIGLVPEYLGKFIVLNEARHYTDAIAPGFRFFDQNLGHFIKSGIPALGGILTGSYMKIYGFYIPGDLRKLAIFFTWITFLFIWVWLPVTVPVSIIKELKGRDKSVSMFEKLKEYQLNPEQIVRLLFFLVTGVNVFALLAVNITDDYAVRYLMPSVGLTPVMMTSAFFYINENKRKVARSLLGIFLFLIFIGYAKGNTEPEFLNFQGSPNIKDVSAYLEKNNIKYSLGSYWISWGLMKESNLSHTSSPSYDTNAAYYEALHEKVMNVAKSGKMIAYIHPGVPKRQIYDESSGILHLQEGDFSISEKEKIGPWRIFLIKLNN